MIASLHGKIIAKDLQRLVVETGGIGYSVFVTPPVAAGHAVGEDIQLHTYLQVREDALVLFGFVEHAELEFFEMLITVSGVGPKVALSVLSAGNAEMVKQAIASSDVAVFTKVGGVGRKTAEKIIVELKDKVGALGYARESASGSSEDLIRALEQLGYSQMEIKDVLPKLDRSSSPEEQLRVALKELSKR
jgi:Holliday junction DNA helicase RuvA